MNKFKVLTIIGARPQFIKAAAVSRILRRKFKEIILHTGQHYDIEMSGSFFKELKISRPDYNLGVGSASQAKQVALMLERIEPVLLKEKPDLVLVYGDTNSTLAAALSAAKLGIPIAHVESGMRSYNRSMPEEINRIVADKLSSILFCSSKNACDTLMLEGITKNVYLVGDVMLDSLKHNIRTAERKSRILSALRVRPKEYFLATIHRPLNTDDPKRLKTILDILNRLSLPVIMPLHPRTRNILCINKNSFSKYRNLTMINPLPYLDTLVLEENSRIIFTDSGGVQKEAFFLNVPCITLREETEWIETVDSGWNILAGANKLKIMRAIEQFESKPITGKKEYCYGHGNAAEKIVRILSGKMKQLSVKNQRGRKA